VDGSLNGPLTLNPSPHRMGRGKTSATLFLTVFKLGGFAHLAAIAIPTDLDRVSVLIPGSISVRFLPILLQLGFELVIPVSMLVAIVGAGTITEAIGILNFLIGRLSTWRDRLFSSGLLNGIVDVLICVRLVAAEVVLRLVPIALEGRFHLVPGRVVLLVPPFWIFTLFHT
jgi:hypothetical protein